VNADTRCRDIYKQTSRFGPIETLCREKNMGFEILLGAPFLNPPLAFLGYQPGGGPMDTAEARARGYEESWVEDTCQFATAPWGLARRLREVFPVEVLAKSVALNALFVRAKSVAEYERIVSLGDRRQIQKFCAEHVRTILDLIAPRNLIVIGHRTLDLFCKGRPALKNSRGRILVKTGDVFGWNAHAVLHLTGARIGADDRRAIKGYLDTVLPAALDATIAPTATVRA
jgi:hypothetical protein